MNNEDLNEQAEQSAVSKPLLSRRIRLVGRLMRAEMQRTLRAEQPPTRGEVKAAMRAIESRATEAVSAEDLATTLATLDKIAEAFGGRDALPFRPGGRRHGFGRGHGPRRHEQSIALRAACPEPAPGLGRGCHHGHNESHGFGPHRRGRSHGFAPHH